MRTRLDVERKVNVPLRVRAASIAALALLAGLAIGWLPLSQLGLLTAGVVLLIVIAATLSEPVIGLAITLVIAPFAPLENIMLRLPIDSGQLMLGLTLGAWVLRLLHEGRWKIDSLTLAPLRRGGRTVWVALLIFVAAALLSFFAATSFEAWAKESLKWLEVLAVCGLVAVEKDPRRRALVVGAILVSGAFQGCFGIYQFALRGEGPDEFAILGGRYFRSYGTFEQPNPFGGYVGLIWPLAAGIAVWAARQAYGALRMAYPQHATHNTRYAKRMIAIAAFSAFTSVVCLAALVLSWSRGAWLGAGAAAAAMLFAATRKPVLTLALAAAAVVVVAAFNLASLLPESLRDRLTDFTQQFSSFDVRGVQVTADSYSIVERLAHWQAAENMILERPYTGVGFGNYETAYPSYRALNWPIALGHAHNYYLNIWAETGVFGFLAYLAMWVAVMARTAHVAHASRSMLAAYLAVGLLGAWAHLAVHLLVDNLYVANIYLLIGAYLGLLLTLPIRESPISDLQPSIL